MSEDEFETEDIEYCDDCDNLTEDCTCIKEDPDLERKIQKEREMENEDNN
jgi:hypothetical protein